MAQMLLIAGISIGLGFLLIFLLALSEKKRPGSPPAQPRPEITRSQFEKACLLVIEGMKLEIEEVNRSGENLIDVIARNPAPFIGGNLLVHCLYAPPQHVVGTPQIIELSNMVLQDRLTKGIFITTGRFTNEIPTIGELAPIEFVDGARFQGLIEKYKVVFPS